MKKNLFGNLLVFALLLLVAAGAFAATTYTATKGSDKNLFQPRDATTGTVTSKYVLVSNMVANDVFQMVALPGNVTVTDVQLVTETIGNLTVLNVGYGGNAAYFIGNTTIGQTGGLVVTNGMAAGPLYLANTDTIDIKCITGPGTGVLANMWLIVTYTGSNP